MNCLIKLSKLINNYIQNSNKKYIIRNRKISFLDLIAFRLLYTQKGFGQEKVSSALNDFLNIDISRSSYAEKEAKIDIEFYEKLYILISEFISKNTNSRIKQIIAIDGTHTNVNSSLNLDEYKPKKPCNTFDILISGAYNVTYNYPISLDMVNHKNEKKAFIEFHKNYEKFENAIFIFDRGYCGYKFYHELVKRNISFICRVNERLNVTKTDLDDYNTTIIVDGKEIKIRVVKYTINGKNYYLMTNLFDCKEYDIDTLKQLYFDRWTIEEFFKFAKAHFTVSKMPTKKIKSIKKTLLCSLIASQLVHFVAYVYLKRKLKTTETAYKVDKSVLVTGFFTKFILKFLYAKGFDYKFLNRFGRKHIKFYIFRPDRHFERKCVTPYLRWFGKQNITRNAIRKKKILKEINKLKEIETIQNNQPSLVPSENVTTMHQ